MVILDHREVMKLTDTEDKYFLTRPEAAGGAWTVTVECADGAIMQLNHPTEYAARESISFWKRYRENQRKAKADLAARDKPGVRE